MEFAGSPAKDSPEVILRPRPWLQKFIAWKALVMNGCPAAGGPGGIFCFWIGRNCSFNDCPRRNFEEDELINEAVLKVEELQRQNKTLRQTNQGLNVQIKNLKKPV